jgi:tetratricopeptide (TPR) repeat protein
MDSRDDRLARAKKLRRESDTGAAAARLILLKLLEEYPDDAEILTDTAFVHDQLGQEAVAVGFYARALAKGVMNLPNREHVYLGLGSSLRVLGRYEDARAVLEKASGMFPENTALKVFLAMVLHNLKDHAAAMRILLLIIAKGGENPDVKPYVEALEYYADRLDRVWV